MTLIAKLPTPHLTNYSIYVEVFVTFQASSTKVEEDNFIAYILMFMANLHISFIHLLDIMNKEK